MNALFALLQSAPDFWQYGLGGGACLACGVLWRAFLRQSRNYEVREAARDKLFLDRLEKLAERQNELTDRMMNTLERNAKVSESLENMIGTSMIELRARR